MKTHLRRLLMCCLLLLILPMAAFAEENELPVEWVRYGYGLPNPASVDAHGLTEEAITLEGVAYAPKLENGRVYVRLEDLVAAKLVRENGDALQTLGLAVSDLQIENGQLKAPGKEEALARFLSTAGVGVSLNDSFTLANAGEGKLIIRIAGFVGKESTDAAPTTSSNGVEVAAKGSPDVYEIWGTTTERPEMTTIYVYYSGATGHIPSRPVCYATSSSQEQTPPDWLTVSDYYIGIAYSQEDIDNSVRYYLTPDEEIPNNDLEFEIWDENRNELDPGTPYEAQDVADKPVEEAYRSDKTVANAGHDSRDGKLFPTIRVSTDSEGKDVIKTIRFEDKTPRQGCFRGKGSLRLPRDGHPAGGLRDRQGAEQQLRRHRLCAGRGHHGHDESRRPHGRRYRDPGCRLRENVEQRTPPYRLNIPAVLSASKKPPRRAAFSCSENIFAQNVTFAW